MTQLSEAVSPSIGEPARFEKLTWVDFVACVLRLTVKAYRAMHLENVAQRNWEENVFTLRLGEDYLRPIAFDNESPISCKSGEEHTLRA